MSSEISPILSEIIFKDNQKKETDPPLLLALINPKKKVCCLPEFSFLNIKIAYSIAQDS